MGVGLIRVCGHKIFWWLISMVMGVGGQDSVKGVWGSKSCMKERMSFIEVVVGFMVYLEETVA